MSVVESLLHLGVFVALAALVGIGALAVIERLAGSGRPIVRLVHIAIAAGILVLFVAADLIHDLLA
jgi:hypothetical protein